jgi:hypothetical protein
MELSSSLLEYCAELVVGVVLSVGQEVQKEFMGEGCV